MSDTRVRRMLRAFADYYGIYYPSDETEASGEKVNVAEAEQEKVTADVNKTLDHLRNNRTTEREAADVQEAARRSLVDHQTSKSLKNNG